jgi:hypothetical protein
MRNGSLKELAGLARQPLRSATRTLSTIAIFTSLIIASDFALAPILNVKLMDTVVFASAYVFGFRTGASIAMLSEFIWSVITPYGFFLPIIPFLVAGELLFAATGYAVSRIWGMEKPTMLSSRNLFFGAILSICAFIWDFETNIASGLVALWPNVSLVKVLLFEIPGIPFMIPHELSDFVLGAALAPVIIAFSARFRMTKPIPNVVTLQKEA